MKLSTRIAGIAAVALAVPALAGVAIATVPSTSDGTITACVTDEGTPRIIDTEAGDACAEGETAVSWSSGWEFKSFYDHTASYQAGDVVLAPDSECPAGVRGYIGGSTWLKVRTSAEVELPSYAPENQPFIYANKVGCPGRYQDWVPLYRGMDSGWIRSIARSAVAFGSVRIGVNDYGRTVCLVNDCSSKVYNMGDGTVWVYLPNQYADSCALTATTVSNATTFVNRRPTDYEHWVRLATVDWAGRPVRVPVDVMIQC